MISAKLYWRSVEARDAYRAEIKVLQLDLGEARRLKATYEKQWDKAQRRAEKAERKVASLTARIETLDRFHCDVIAGCDIDKGAQGLFRQKRVVIGPGKTQDEIDNAVLQTALASTLDRLNFYVSCLPMSAAAYAETREGQVTLAVIKQAEEALAQKGQR